MISAQRLTKIHSVIFELGTQPFWPWQLTKPLLIPLHDTDGVMTHYYNGSNYLSPTGLKDGNTNCTLSLKIHPKSQIYPVFPHLHCTHRTSRRKEKTPRLCLPHWTPAAGHCQLTWAAKLFNCAVNVHLFATLPLTVVSALVGSLKPWTRKCIPTNSLPRWLNSSRRMQLTKLRIKCVTDWDNERGSCYGMNFRKSHVQSLPIFTRCKTLHPFW